MKLGSPSTNNGSSFSKMETSIIQNGSGRFCKPPILCCTVKSAGDNLLMSEDVAMGLSEA